MLTITSDNRFFSSFKRILAVAVCASAFCGVASARAPLASSFTYQGKLKAAGSVVDGTADLQFTLFDDPTVGNQVGVPVSVTNVTIVDGRFTTQLDFGAAAFDGDARWLQIAVRSPAGSGVFQTLSPRQPLTATPYARHAVSAETAENGGVLTTVPNGTPGVMWTRSPNNVDVFLSGSTNAGLGFSSPVARLHVRAPAAFPAETSRFEDVFGRSQLRLATPESAGRAELQAWNGQTNVAGPLIFNVAGGNVGIGTNAPSSLLDVAGSFESNAFRLNGNGAAAGRILTSDASGNGTWQAAPTATQWTTNGTNIGYTAGNVGVGVTTPVNRLDVEGGLAVGSAFSGASAAPANGLIVEGRMGVGTATPNSNFQTQFAGGAGVWRGAIAGTGTTNAFVAGELSGVATVGGHNAALSAWADLAINPAGGNVGIGTTAPVSKLDVAGTVTADNLSILAANNTAATVESSSAAGTWLNLRNSSSGGRYWKMISTGSGNGEGAGKLLIGNSAAAGTLDSNAMTIESDGDIGIGTSTPTAKLDVVGMAKVQVLTITGGADVAEPFNINSDEATEGRSDGAGGDVDLHSKIQNPKSKIEPGMVVVIDPVRTGELRVSGRAYDRTVAGIVSGANGVNPGMVLSQTGTIADGKHPVALTGRVWCWVDADAGGAIGAGDMLTTSDTPGHAMRVNDQSKANGAVIGKAMSSLESGKGMVLVLVNLQ
ncbi:MAG: hypothetical protein ACKVS9_05610 [Phycisphaerae bacterium]